MDCVLVASGVEVKVGVDCEVLVALDDLAGVAALSFSPAECDDRTLFGTAALTSRFYTLWTRKETEVVAIVVGLSLPLSHLPVFGEE